jgi:hypothetical protein
MKTEISTCMYEASHRKSPRGRGSWAFCDETKYRQSDYLNHTIFISGTYAEAKKIAVQTFTKQGIEFAYALP